MTTGLRSIIRETMLEILQEHRADGTPAPLMAEQEAPGTSGKFSGALYRKLVRTAVVVGDTANLQTI